MMEKQNFPLIFAFLIGVQLLAVFFYYSLAAAQVEAPPYEPFGNATVAQAGLNAASLVLPAFISVLVLVFLLKMFGLRFFTFLISVMPLLIVVIVNPLFVSAAVGNYFPDIADAVALTSTAVLAAVVFYSTIKHVRWLSAASTFVISAEVGAFFAYVLQPPTLFAVPIAFALYDIYAVFAGPLKTFISQLTKSNLPKARNPSTSRVRRSLNLGVLAAMVGGLMIGTGDLVFYSMTVAAAFALAGTVGTIATLVALNAGVALTFYILAKYKKILPGLPIPIFLGVAVLMLVHYLL